MTCIFQVSFQPADETLVGRELFLQPNRRSFNSFSAEPRNLRPHEKLFGFRHVSIIRI